MNTVTTTQATTTRRPAFNPFTTEPSGRGTFADYADSATAPHIDHMFDRQLGRYITDAREWVSPTAALFVVQYEDGLYGPVIWHGMAQGKRLVSDELNTLLFSTPEAAHHALMVNFETLYPGELMWFDNGSAAPLPF